MLTLRMTNMVWEIGNLLSVAKQYVDDIRRIQSFWQYELDIFQQNGLNDCDVAVFWCVYLLNLDVIFIFSSLGHYIYCSTLSSTIILCILIILLLTLIAIIINHCFLLLLLPLLFNFIDACHLKCIYIYVYIFINWYMDLLDQKGVFLSGFLTLRCCKLKE